MLVNVLLFDGVEELDAVGPYEVFGVAAGADCRVETVTLERSSVVAANGLQVVPDGTLPAPGDDAPDLLVVPGGGWNDGDDSSRDRTGRDRSDGTGSGRDDGTGDDRDGRTAGDRNDGTDDRTGRDGAGVRRVVREGRLPAAVRDHRAGGAQVASVCTGAMVLERAGLLAERPATTHHSAREDLRAAGVDVRDRRVVDAGDVVTAGGVTSGIDLALYLVERAFGDEVAARTARVLEHDRPEDVARQ